MLLRPSPTKLGMWLHPKQRLASSSTRNSRRQDGLFRIGANQIAMRRASPNAILRSFGRYRSRSRLLRSRQGSPPARIKRQGQETTARSWTSLSMRVLCYANLSSPQPSVEKSSSDPRAGRHRRTGCCGQASVRSTAMGRKRTSGDDGGRSRRCGRSRDRRPDAPLNRPRPVARPAAWSRRARARPVAAAATVLPAGSSPCKCRAPPYSAAPAQDEAARGEDSYLSLGG